MSAPVPVPAVEGFLNIDKPAGMTSHDVVARVRRVLRTKRAGHAGTLDPDATGVLVVAVGQATRLLPFLPGEPKEYVARLLLGVSTTTEDASGEIVDSADASRVTEADLAAVLLRFSGEIKQIPPMVSAVHHEGKRLYELARAGVTVEREPRKVTIHAVEMTDFAPGPQAEATLRVVCGGGTYIRTLCADIGKALDLPAHMKTLRRTRVGAFALDDAIPLERLESDGPAALIPIENVLDFPAVEITDGDAARLNNGMAVTPPEGAPETDVETPVALRHNGRLRALARRENGVFQPFKVFPA